MVLAFKYLLYQHTCFFFRISGSIVLYLSRTYFHSTATQEMFDIQPLMFILGSTLKDRAHLSTFKFVIFEKFSCFIVLVVFLVVVQSSELISVWFCEKMTFKKNISYHIFAIYVGGASLGVPTACRLIAVSGARLPSADGLAVRCIKNAPPC